MATDTRAVAATLLSPWEIKVAPELTATGPLPRLAPAVAVKALRISVPPL